MQISLYSLRLAAARHMAVELDDRGEKHAAHTIAGLLAIIEELDPQVQADDL